MKKSFEIFFRLKIIVIIPLKLSIYFNLFNLIFQFFFMNILKMHKFNYFDE